MTTPVRFVALASVIVTLVASQPPVVVGAAQASATTVEIAIVANAEAGTIAFLDVAAQAVVGKLDVNPARVKSEGPGAPNYAQDTDVSPDGRTLYVSRGYLGDVAAFDLVSGRL